MRAAPLTVGYFVLLLATTLLLRHVRPSTAARLLQASSTDVAHLTRDPIAVLVASAAWLPGKLWSPYAVIFLLALTLMEGRFGAGRAGLVFFSGHVLATLLTELPIAAAILLHWRSPSAAHRLDVGVSYGMFTVIAAGAGALPRRRRVLLFLGVSAWLVWQAWADPDMTACGHLLALAIGLAWWPVLYPSSNSSTVSEA